VIGADTTGVEATGETGAATAGTEVEVGVFVVLVPVPVTVTEIELHPAPPVAHIVSESDPELAP
jgi:hypothetical protein